jgi:hypothetical protein
MTKKSLSKQTLILIRIACVYFYGGENAGKQKIIGTSTNTRRFNLVIYPKTDVCVTHIANLISRSVAQTPTERGRPGYWIMDAPQMKLCESKIAKSSQLLINFTNSS